MELPQKYSEQELVWLLKQRNEQAYSYLYDHYSGALFSVILCVVKEEELAADVLQEVFIKIWRQISLYDTTKGRLYTWMLNVARNTSIDAIRSKGVKNSRQNQELTENVYEQAGSAEMKTDAIGLRKLVHTLKDEWKILIELSYFEGYTQDEMAKMLNIPLGTVKTRLRSGLAALSKIIKK